MAKYNKDTTVKFQCKFLKDTYHFPIPFIAAIQAVSPATAHCRYQSITDEIDIYPDVAAQYQAYIEKISSCKLPALTFSR